jgi:hypothetical protein
MILCGLQCFKTLHVVSVVVPSLVLPGQKIWSITMVKEHHRDIGAKATGTRELRSGG